MKQTLLTEPQSTSLPRLAPISVIIQAVFRHPLRRQLSQDVGEVVGVREAVARHVGTKLCLVMDLVPDHGVGFSRRDRRPDGEDEPPLPGDDEEPQNLSAYFIVR